MSGRFSQLSTKIRQTIYHLKHGFFSVENIILTAAVCLCLFWTYESISAMTRNWQLTETLATEKKELELLEIEVETAELENEYYQTEEYQETAARKYLNKKYPDEQMVYLPKNSEEAKNKHASEQTVIEPRTYTNFEKWLLFLFPKHS